VNRNSSDPMRPIRWLTYAALIAIAIWFVIASAVLFGLV